MNYIKSLIVKFENELRANATTMFRGAVIAIDENKDDILFHSHDGEELRYAYPLIQYKTINGRAAIVALDAGTDSVARMLYPYERELRVGNVTETYVISETLACSTNVDFVKEPVKYSLRNWMPLNKENYQAYTSTKDMVEQLAILKRMLIGNILSFAKGIGLHLEDELKVQMIDSEERRPVMYKNQKMMAFNVEFTSNLRLPQYIGLGKGVSVGYGVAREIK